MQSGRLLASCCRPSVCLTACNAVQCGGQGRCRVKSCVYSMLFQQTLFQQMLFQQTLFQRSYSEATLLTLTLLSVGIASVGIVSASQNVHHRCVTSKQLPIHFFRHFAVGCVIHPQNTEKRTDENSPCETRLLCTCLRCFLVNYKLTLK